MRLLTKLTSFVLFILCAFHAEAQIQTPGYRAELGGIVKSGTQKPFWLMSNQGGRYHPDNSSLFGGIYIGSEVERQNDFFEPAEDTVRKLQVDYGIEAFNRYNGDYDLRLQQYYTDVSWWYFNLHAGARRETFGNQHNPLSSGSLLYSGNARPIPKIAASSDYIPVPFSKGYIEFKGYLSHGWFEKDRYTENPFLHHKNAYVRVGGDFPINAHYGFHHYAMWGGVSPNYGQIPDDLEAYKKIFFSEKGDESSLAPEGDIINALGDHIGSRNFGLDYKGEDISLHLYWQTIFEDNSGKAWRNIRDGLWGVVYENRQKHKPIVKSALYEFLRTTDQSGKYHDIDGENVGGNDNYFNNYLYKSGWTFDSYTIGTPMITSPIMNNKENIRMFNNKVIAHQLGVKGWLLNNLHYRALMTYSINYGTNSSPFEPAKKEYSVLTEFNYKLPEQPDWQFKMKVAADFGDMYGKNFGVFFGVTKKGWKSR